MEALLFITMCWCLVGLWGYCLLQHKGHEPWMSIIAGIVMGPVSIFIALASVRSSRCWICGAPTNDDEQICHHCHTQKT